MQRIVTLLVLIVFISLFFNCGGGNEAVLRKIPVEKQQVLAILKFKNQSSSKEYEPWEMGLASMVMTDLSKIGVFRIVTREQMKEILQEQELGMSGIVDANTATQIGKVLGAKYLLMGTFIEFKGTLRMEAQIFNTEKTSMVKAEEITGKTDQFFELEKQLVLKISQNLDVALSDDEKQVIAKSIATKSVQASLQNYAGVEQIEKAEQLKDQGKADEAKKLEKQAESKFKKALEYDPKYEEARDNLNRLGLSVPISF